MQLIKIFLLLIIAPTTLACEKPLIPIEVKIKGEIENSGLKATSFYIVAPVEHQGWTLIRATYEDGAVSVPINGEGSSKVRYFHLTLDEGSLKKSKVFVSYKKETEEKPSCVHKQEVEFGI